MIGALPDGAGAAQLHGCPPERLVSWEQVTDLSAPGRQFLRGRLAGRDVVLYLASESAAPLLHHIVLLTALFRPRRARDRPARRRRAVAGAAVASVAGALWSLAAATLAGALSLVRFLAAAAIRRRQLQREEPGADLSGEIPLAQRDVLYIKTNFAFSGVEIGGATAHTLGVLNGVAGLARRTVCLAVEPLAQADPAVHQVIVPGPRSAPLLPSWYGLALSRCLSAAPPGLVSDGAMVYQRNVPFCAPGLRLARRYKGTWTLEYNGSEAWVARKWGKGGALLAVLASFERAALLAADRVVVVSTVLADELRALGVAEHRIRVLPERRRPGVCDSSRVTAEEVADVRASLGIAPDALVVTFVGTFGKWHGAEVLADAVELWAREDSAGVARRRAVFVFAGDGLMLPEVKRRLSADTASRFVRLPGMLPHGRVLTTAGGLRHSRVAARAQRGRVAVLREPHEAVRIHGDGAGDRRERSRADRRHPGAGRARRAAARGWRRDARGGHPVPSRQRRRHQGGAPVSRGSSRLPARARPQRPRSGAREVHLGAPREGRPGDARRHRRPRSAPPMTVPPVEEVRGSGMKQIVQNIRDGSIDVLDVPTPPVTPGMVLVQVAFSVVSAGTERATVEFGQQNLVQKVRSRPDVINQVRAKIARDGLKATFAAVTSRLAGANALGYSCSGRVVAVGDGVSDLRPGDLVACAGAGYASHAEFVSVPNNLVAPIPGDRDDLLEAAAFTTIGAIALQGVRLANVSLGESVAVVGLGLLGQMLVMILRAAGCTVVGFDPNQQRVESGAAGRHGRRVRLGRRVSPPVRRRDGRPRRRRGARRRGDEERRARRDGRRRLPRQGAGRRRRRRGPAGAEAAVLPEGDRVRRVAVLRSGALRPDLRGRGPRLSLPVRPMDRAPQHGGDPPDAGEGAVVERGPRLAPVSGRSGRRRVPDDRERLDRAVPRRRADVSVIVDAHGARGRARRSRPSAPRATLGVGVVGAGSFLGAAILPRFQNVPGVRLRGVANSSGVSSHNAARRFGFGYAAASIDELLQDRDVDLIVLGTPHNLHAPQVIAALDAGKHVFVEKPLCLTLGELDAIRRVAETRPQLGLMVGFNRRFSPLSAACRRRRTRAASR